MATAAKAIRAGRLPRHQKNRIGQYRGNHTKTSGARSTAKRRWETPTTRTLERVAAAMGIFARRQPNSKRRGCTQAACCLHCRRLLAERIVGYSRRCITTDDSTYTYLFAVAFMALGAEFGPGQQRL